MNRKKFGSFSPTPIIVDQNPTIIHNDDGSINSFGSDSNHRRYSTQLQPINEENGSNKSSPTIPSGQYLNLQQSIKSGTSKMIGNGRSIVVPNSTNNLDQNGKGFTNPAYDNYGDTDESDSYDETTINELQQQQQQRHQPMYANNNAKRMARQVSFDPETPNHKNQSKISQPFSDRTKVKKTNSNDSIKSGSDKDGNNNQSNNKQETKEKPPEWDRFITEPPPDEDETQKSEWVEVAIRWLKLFAYFFTFIMVLLLSVCSKTLILLMTSMINVNHTVTICNNDDHFEIDPPLDHDKPYNVVYHRDSITRIAWVWSLYFAAISPYFFAFGRSVRITYFKKFKFPKIQTMLTVFVAETLHCIGLSIFLFILLPEMDVIRGAMIMNSVCFLPSVIRLLVDPPPPPKQLDLPFSLDIRQSFQSTDGSSIFEDSFSDEFEDSTGRAKSKFEHLKLAYNRWLAWINFSLQTLLIICWTAISAYDNYKYNECEHFYLIPIAMILVSFEWWENYVVPDAMKKFSMFLSNAKNDLTKSRYFVFAVISPWKILFIFALMIMNEHYGNGSDTTRMIFKNFTDSFQSDIVSIIRDKTNFGGHVILDTDQHELHVDTALWPVWILVAHVFITYLAYAFAKFTCKVCFQSISFAVPLCLTVPCTVSVLWALNSIALQDKCQLVSIFKPFQYIFFNEEETHVFKFNWYNAIVAFIWMISFINQVLNTLHIWKETSERLASTEQLFVSPMYNTVMIDQSLLMNRRCLKLIYAPEDEDRGEESTTNKDVEQQQSKIDTKDPLKPQVNLENKLDGELPRTSYNPMYDWNNHVDGMMNQSKSSENNIEDDWTKDWRRVCEIMGVEEDSIDAKTDPADDETIRIYICATMWHEDENEMFQMLKAVMRLDYEQGLRRIAKKEFGDAVKKTIYEMEVNIFFDDAFEQGKGDDVDDRVINRFVEQLIDTIGGSANQVFGKNLDLEPPTIVPTPYGGKLIWKMPMGTNRLIAHIKDKDLIRHRKRWSQCMYMYYLLGYRLAARKDLDIKRRKTIMNNTFVLALDGDINFRPAAVDLVVDLMKKNDNLGAACGRIHPIGSGPIVWYQKFEYAMGHWLQKATEHVIGCVLCSPGCFSLFRARALMDKSIMNKYTTKPTQAQHYVQYDQGEDRWLCTLLLQRGWRIEYCAASDSYTHAPEGFAEFYTQRRRWGPSTMANILDLLGDYKQTVKANDNISYLYIIYQAFLMLGTIISPGTIFLMVVSAMNTVMGLTTEMSLIYNMIPLLLFLFVCLQFEDNNIKISFATVLSVIYALLMLAVLVGTGIDMYTKGFFSPNSLFFSAMMGSFIVAAVLHPQEFACVIPLPIYMLFIPSMYMLLTIYSITNMNVVSWGTREVKSKLSAKELAKQKEEEEARAKAAAAAKKKGNFLNLDTFGSSKNGLFTCMCCSGTNESSVDETMGVDIKDIKLHMKEMAKLISKESKSDHNSERDGNDQNTNAENENKNSEGEQHNQQQQQKSDNNDKRQGDANKNSSGEHICRRSPPTTRIGSFQKPRWVRSNSRLNSWPIRNIPGREEEFWKKMIAKYLYPLDEDLKEKDRISSELADLRNKFVFAFSFVNIIFILFVFMLQIHKDVFGIDVPVGTNGTTEIRNEDEDRIEHVNNIVYTRMDPINLTLVIFFGAILIIQCIGMFIHRFGTLAHLLAYTEIREKKKQIDYSSLVAQLIREKSRRNGRRRRRRHYLNKVKDRISDSNLTTDDEEYKTDDDGKGSMKSSDTDDVKPSEYGNVFGEVMQNLKSDQSRIEKIPKMIRKNTKHAIRKHEQHLQQMQNKIHRDSIHSAISAFGLERDSSNASSYAHHRRLFHTNSNQSAMSQQTVIEQPSQWTNNRPMTTFSTNQTNGTMTMNSPTNIRNRTDTLTSDEEISQL
ncbi:Chitin synthase 2 [Dermatophagoides farinae]|uniref:chitin synthase n=1 Tax=Dermatophagoides farinae TaxID=6954 RepID=A0A922HPK3_DERFA|nr:chitin synthase chs-2-like [Dermatophagoides farinae]XP_046916576.1 chitin synthase chs-2-like [Dermatophagoides farinae]KAH7637874.1 chitin synthase-like protein 1 [Dermatophagoides farinae]KAH9501355.1 Chitin synthase 2 [Dermatophagoides farinae]